MSLVQIILVVIVAFIIGCSSVNDQIETYQPVVACSLIGLVTGHLELGVSSPISIFRQAETLAVHIWKVNSEGTIPDGTLVSAGSAAVLQS